MTELEKGTDGLNENDVFLIKQKYFGLKMPIGEIADRFYFKPSQVIRAVQLNEVVPIVFSEADFETGRWLLRKG